MEDNIQTIIVVIISAFLLFIFPVYVAYEKKDDISYALAMRYTQDLVDEVRSKGYLTKNMYEDYRAKLKVTGNTYDIQMTHEYNRYDPITNYYKLEDGKYILVKTTTREQREKFEQEKLEELPDTANDIAKQEHLQNAYNDLGITKVEDTYKLSKETYTKDHIVAVLNSERKLKLNSSFDEVVSCSDKEEDDSCQYAYIMNVDDNFNVTIKNTNITLATVIYNMVTANTLDSNTRIYVNYGGAILSNKWQGNIDYSKMDHDNISLNKFKETIIFSDKRVFKIDAHPIEEITEPYNGQYVLDFDVKPNAVTDLREKGPLRVADYTKYNFAAGNMYSNNYGNNLSVSVGLNGISLISHNVKKYNASLNRAFDEYKIVLSNKAKTLSCQMEKTYISEGEEGQEIITKVYEAVACNDIANTTDLADYKNISVKYESEGKFLITLEGKNSVNNVKVEVFADTEARLRNLNYSLDYPSSDITIKGDLSGVTTNSGGTLEYNIVIGDSKLVIFEQSEDRTTVSDYSSASVTYDNGQIKLTMTSDKPNVSTFTKNLDINGDKELLKDLNASIEDLTVTSEIPINFERNINARSTNITGKIIFNQDSIIINAGQEISEEMTIMSYPATINEYANIRIEWQETEATKKLEADKKKYIAMLYIDNEKVDESIELDVIPKVNVVGKTIIGNEERFFTGSIRNAKIYALATN